MPNVALCILAHPDDAEILCGGTLIRLADAGWQIHIATMTPGDCGTMEKDRWQIAAIRTAEACKAAAMIGATYHCLDERDGFIVYDKPTIRKTMDLFRTLAPNLVLTHAPRDYMVDHEQTSLIARGASFIYAAPNVSTLPRLPGSAVPHLYYCDALDGVDPLGAPIAPTTLIDITAVLEKKLGMLACHESQRAWLRAHHHVDEYLEATRRNAARLGKLANTPAAEGFIQHRGHGYPHDDLLATLFP